MTMHTKRNTTSGEATYGINGSVGDGLGSTADGTVQLLAGGVAAATATASGIQLAAQTTPVEIITGADTLDAADSGKVIAINSTTSRIITLPATAAGLTYTVFVATAATSGAGHSVAPVAADKIMESSVTVADDKSLINTQATGKSGDSLTLVGDGVDGWYVIAKTGTWARQT